jgi:hypothetical protein
LVQWASLAAEAHSTVIGKTDMLMMKCNFEIRAPLLPKMCLILDDSEAEIFNTLKNKEFWEEIIAYVPLTAC